MEATFIREFNERQLQAAATSAAGELWQLPNGRAGFQNMGGSRASGLPVKFIDAAEVGNVPKTTGVAFVDGDEVWWDHSTGLATYCNGGDRDYYLGTAVGDYVAASSAMLVSLGTLPMYKVDLRTTQFDSVIVGTLGDTTGFTYPPKFGSSYQFEMTATNEAQKQDLMSVDDFAVGSNPIIDFCINVVSGGAASAVDFNIGVANATHATNFDSITQYLAFHLNSNDVNIYAQSADGSTTVAAADTTIDYTAGRTRATRVYGKIDLRDPTSAKLYLNGSPVLTGTTFDVSAATGPWLAIAHVEKTSSTDAFKAWVSRLTVRTGEQ